MEQVRIQMYKYILINIILLSIIFSGCSIKQQPDFTKKQYTNIDPNSILNAAKKVIKLSDKRFNISSNINKIVAKRAVAIYKAYDVDLQINTITLETIIDGNITQVKLTITQKKDYFDPNTNIIKDSTHQLMWDRIDYILGLKNNWPSCLKNQLEFYSSGILCNILYNQNNKATKYDKLYSPITLKKDIKVLKKNDIANIKLENLEDIKLPINKINYDTNNTIQEINLDNIK